MANYYNVAGWRKTGFNFYNRPYNREVLNRDEFRDGYFVIPTISVNRQDMMEINYIDIQGSVKDLTGTQINEPNQTGPQGPGGPWYSWEEVDYIRLTRTGYPGDPDYVDISGNVDEPWLSGGGGGKLFIAYYFVTGLEPMARNVTRVFLAVDTWTTMGGADELFIETGYKIRGHVTEEEDEEIFNLAPEAITNSSPLEVKSHEVLQIPGATVENTEFLVSSIDLTQYQSSMSIDAFVAQAAGGQTVAFPSLRAVDDGGWIRLIEPGDGGAQYTYFLYGYRAFDQRDTTVQHNLSILYSAGQLELQDSYQIPTYLIDVVKDGGRYTSVANKTFSVKPTFEKEMSYPRKADYMLGMEVLYSLTTGDMNVQPLYNVDDDTVFIWSLATPTGSPYARFKDIKNHPFLYDQSVQGMTWIKKAVVLQGASGSMWNQVNNNFAQQTLNRNIAENNTRNAVADAKYKVDKGEVMADTAISIGRTVSSGVSVGNLLSGGNQTWDAVELAKNAAVTDIRMAIDRKADLRAREYKEQSLDQAQNQIMATFRQAEFKAPFTSFVPDLSRQLFTPNSFGVYVVNVGQNDRNRLRSYFLRYGYNGQYKPLTWETINVKQRVNYIEAEGVCFAHDHYSMRALQPLSSLFRNGIFLWNEKPNQAAFLDNPDN